MKAEIKYDKLIVNPENYRFDSVDNENQAIGLMLQEKGLEILNLAKDLYIHGLDEAKDIRVLQLKNDFLVLDGNRRITAIKCLHDTKIIKDKKLKNQFEEIINKIEGKIPELIKCYIYNNEEIAARWINLDHTGKNEGIGQDPWGAPEKDRFNFKFGGILSPAAQAIEMVENEMNTKFDSKKLKISTINRILSNPESRSFLGINIKNKKLQFLANKKEIISRLNTLFTKIIVDDVRVAEVYDADMAKVFMNNLFGEKPESSNLTIPGTDKEQENKEPSQKGNREAKRTKGLYIKKSKSKRGYSHEETIVENDEYVPGVKQRKIEEIYNELKLISVKKCPTAISALIRILVDITVKDFLDKKGYSFNKEGHLIIKVTGQKNKTSLKEKMNYISDNYIESSELKKSIVALNEDYFTQSLNEVMHNCIFSATETKVRDLWKNLKPFLEFLWLEIISSNKS